MERDWGKDPQVRYLRDLFGRIEAAQRALLEQLGITPLDYRLRRVRQATLRSFEKAWIEAERTSGQGAEKRDEVVSLYLHCLARALSANRVPVPADLLPQGAQITAATKEVFS